jgi:hypothetical protein
MNALKHRDTIISFTTVGLATVLVLLAGLPSQAQVNTSTIEVQTVDDSDSGLPGVTVQVTNTDTGLSRTSVTDAGGVAVFPGLPAGPYTVSPSLEEFASVEQPIVLRVGQTQRLRIGMRLQVSKTITVTAEAPVVDVYKSDASTNIVPEQIKNLPVPDRDFQNLAFIAPGVQRERGGYRFIDDAPLIGSSGNASETAIIVDGVDFTDQALGLSRARFSQDAIGEFRVINNRFDTEIGSSAGGALSVITKSGTNDVHGSAFVFYRDDNLRETGALETGSQDFSRQQLGFTVGGPITLDRTHYFLSMEYIEEDDIALFRPQGPVYGDLARDIAHPFDQLLFLASLDHNISISHNLQFRAVYEDFNEENFRVGGTADESSGMKKLRENWNLSGAHTWMVADNKLSELRMQIGEKTFEEPANSDQLSEWFTFGTTLVTGANIIGDQVMEGEYLSVQDTYHWYLGGTGVSHDIKTGLSVSMVNEFWHYPLLPRDWVLYASDDRTLPFQYNYFIGDTDLEADTTIFGLFFQDDIRLSSNLTFSLGLRYDYDSDANNPDFDQIGHELVGDRSADDNNFQPRIGFTWDVSGNGADVVRGGAGLFTGRYLLVPALIEQQQNGITGVWLQRLNGLFLGLGPEFFLDINDPRNTGVLLAPNITLLEDGLEAPEALQASLGYTRRLGESGLYLDIEGIYSEGDNEIIIRDTNFGGNALPLRVNPNYAQINQYTNEGHSEYTALIVAVNGTVGNGHLIACNATWADKKNIADDFSPALTNYPSDPADIEAEWGRSRADEQLRVVLSGVFRLPWNLTVAPIYIYGSGQPWNRRRGNDYNFDGRTSDRLPGVERNSEDGPEYQTFNLRLTWSPPVGGGNMEVILEAFNLFNRTNYDVNSVDSAEFLAGPTVVDPTATLIPNPNFGNYSATLDPREIQIGLRYTF